MIIKILKGRSFGGLLDYLLDSQDKPPSREITDSPGNQRTVEEDLLQEGESHEQDRAGLGQEKSPDNSIDEKQRGNRDGNGETKQEQRGEIIIANMAGRNKKELLEHFNSLAALRPDIEVNVLHAILSLPKEDKLSRATKARLVMRFTELKGLDNSMYAAISHDEHEHTEIHTISSTINFKGKLPSDSFDFERGETIARQLEKEFGLTPNKSSRDAMQRTPTQGEWKQFERKGELSPPLRLRAVVDSILDREITFTEFAEKLNQRGVALRLLVSDEGKVVGSVYEFKGKHIRGRRLGRGYTWPGLQRDWPDQQERTGRMTYDAKRDYEAFSRAGSSAFGRTNEAGELGRRVGAIHRDGEATERAERSAGANRKPSYQTYPVSEEGRATIRYYRAGGQGIAGGDRTSTEEHCNELQPVQRRDSGDRRTDQRGVSIPTRDSSAVLRRDLENQRQERADGERLSGNGSDEQRHIQQGQRRGEGNLAENTSASEGHSRSTPQRDRSSGAALQNDLQAAEQVNPYRNGSNSAVRLRRRNHGWGDVVLHKATSGRGNRAQDFAVNDEAKEDSDTYSRPAQQAQSTDSKTGIASKTSAVDEVIKTLWNNSSPVNNVTKKSAMLQNQKGGAEESNRKEPETVRSEGLLQREEQPVRNRAPLEVSRDQIGSLSSRKLSQDKHTGRSEQSSPTRSRGR